MFRRTTMILFALMVPVAAAAATGIPDLTRSLVSWDYSGGERLTLLVVPDGSGDGLDAARAPDGSVHDATIHLQVRDGLDYPVANFPFEDLWLEWGNWEVATCPGGSTADANTDAQGNTLWRTPLQAGGSSTLDCQVYINGDTFGLPSLPLQAVSPDMGGDGLVDLSDVATFTMAYFDGYAFEADLLHDGVLNLSDIVVLVHALGRSCP